MFDEFCLYFCEKKSYQRLKGSKQATISSLSTRSTNFLFYFMTYRKSGDRLMPKSQVEVCVLRCCAPQTHHTVISCSLSEDTVFLCVGDSLEKTTWGLRKREAGKLEDRGCPPPPHTIFPPCPQRMQQHKPLWHLRKWICAKGSDHDAFLWCCHHRLRRGGGGVGWGDKGLSGKPHFTSSTEGAQTENDPKKKENWEVVCS